MMPHPITHLTALAGSLLLSACAGFMPPTQVESNVAPAWQAPLPHQGTVSHLADWWQAQGDPLLAELITAAQAVNPSVSQSLARIEAARANQASARSALLPNLAAQAGVSRGVSQPAMAVATTSQIGLQAAWELDVVGANRAVSDAAQANLEASQAQWHDARVLVAAEVANLYFGLSSCAQQLALAEGDAASRAQTARLTAINARVGFLAPSLAALARASAAEGKSRVTQQNAQCDVDAKALVALTAIAEPDLKRKVATTQVKQAPIAPFYVASVPAQTVAQRPDVFAAERDVVVASAQVGNAKAQRLPRLSLNGSIGVMRVSSNSVNQSGATWSFGPLAVSLPLFDGGQREAAVKSAEAHYSSTVVVYRGKVRNAVREVEEALVNLQSTQDRADDTRVSAQGYNESLAATQSRFGQGLASLLELEDARRTALAAESARLALVLERNRAWVALYRALGGGFELATAAAATASPSTPAY